MAKRKTQKNNASPTSNQGDNSSVAARKEAARAVSPQNLGVPVVDADADVASLCDESTTVKRAPKRRRLAAKERKLVAALIKNPDLTLREAGEKAGYAKGSAAQSASRALATPHVQMTLRERMERRKDLRDDALLERLEEGLKAKVVKIAAFEGRITDEREYDDHATRYSYLTLAAKLKGHGVERVDVTTNGKDLNGQAVAQDLSFLKSLTKDELLAALGVPSPVEVINTTAIRSDLPAAQVAPAASPGASGAPGGDV